MYEQPLSAPLPKLIDPRKLAHIGQDVKGAVSTDDLPRIKALVGEGKQLRSLDASLSFGLDERRRPVMTGQCHGVLELDCLRCLLPVDYSLSTSIALAIVWDEEMAETVEGDFEPWIVGEEPANLYYAIEDEILLALPMVVYHDHQCVPKELYSVGEVEPLSDDKANPFAALKLLKNESPEPSDKEN